MPLSFVSLEHVNPKRLNFLNMAALTIHRHPSQREALGELAFQADRLYEWAGGLFGFVIA